MTIDAVSRRSAALDTPAAVHGWWRRLSRDLLERSWRQAPLGIARRLGRPLSDRAYLEIGHLLYFGRWPDFDDPRTFNEHIQAYMLNCRDPLLRVAADKVLCREYITARVGASYLVPMLGCWNRAEDVPLASLPRPYVLKSTAGSGQVLLVRVGDTRPAEDLRRKMRRWLAFDYSTHHREWAYAGLPRRMMAETMLLDADNQPPPDIKAYVIGGAVRFLQVDRGRFTTHHTRNLYGPRWEVLPARLTLDRHQPDPEPPCLYEMRTVAEELARPFEFLRVDFYVMGSRLYIGELTNYPGAGFERFMPSAYADIMGAYWKRDP
jgi:TupA-like ATPgrasp